MGIFLSQEQLSQERGVEISLQQDNRSYLRIFPEWVDASCPTLSLPAHFRLQQMSRKLTINTEYRIILISPNDGARATVVMSCKNLTLRLFKSQFDNYLYQLNQLNMSYEQMYASIARGHVENGVVYHSLPSIPEIHPQSYYNNVNRVVVPILNGRLTAYEADIVLIHGLGDNIDATFRVGEDLHWPSQLITNRNRNSIYDHNLLSPVLRNIRVLGVQHELGNDPHANHEETFDIIYREFKRWNIGIKPVVFIVHSLGGLIIKELLRKSSTDDFYPYIEYNTRGIIFCGTPHRGVPQNIIYLPFSEDNYQIFQLALPERLRKLIKALVSQQVSNYLRPREHLFELNRWYLTNDYDFKYLNFVEGRAITGLGLSIVEPDEGSLPEEADPNRSRSNIILSTEDHLSVAQFCTESHYYRMIRDRVAEWLQVVDISIGINDEWRSWDAYVERFYREVDFAFRCFKHLSTFVLRVVFQQLSTFMIRSDYEEESHYFHPCRKIFVTFIPNHMDLSFDSFSQHVRSFFERNQDAAFLEYRFVIISSNASSKELIARNPETGTEIIVWLRSRSQRVDIETLIPRVVDEISNYIPVIRSASELVSRIGVKVTSQIINLIIAAGIAVAMAAVFDPVIVVPVLGISLFPLGVLAYENREYIWTLLSSFRDPTAARNVLAAADAFAVSFRPRYDRILNMRHRSARERNQRIGTLFDEELTIIVAGLVSHDIPADFYDRVTNTRHRDALLNRPRKLIDFILEIIRRNRNAIHDNSRNIELTDEALGSAIRQHYNEIHRV